MNTHINQVTLTDYRQSETSRRVIACYPTSDEAYDAAGTIARSFLAALGNGHCLRKHSKPGVFGAWSIADDTLLAEIACEVIR